MMKPKGFRGWFPLLALALAVLALLALACEEEEKPTPTPTQAVQATPTPRPEAKPTGDLTVAVPVLTANFGSWERTVGSVQFLSPAADLLVYISRDWSKLIPGLAKEWQVSPDNTSVTFRLREGVQFHDGWGELTSEDVKFTIEAAIGEGSKNGEAISFIKPLIDRIVTEGPYQLTIFAKGAKADLIPWMLSPATVAYLPIVSKKYVESVGRDQANQKGIFAGPYRITEYRANDRLVLEALDTHWRLVGEFKRIIFQAVPEQATRAALLKTGEVDVIETTAEGAKTTAGGDFAVVSVKGATHLDQLFGGLWLPGTPTYDPNVPWLNVKVREAMNIAINRTEIAEKIFSGFARPSSTYRPWPWSNKFQPYPYNPERAKQLLAEAGYPQGFDVSMWILRFPGQAAEIAQMVQAVAGYWEAIGLKTKVETFDSTVVLDKILGRQTSGIIYQIAPTALFPWEQGLANFYSKDRRFPVGGEGADTDALYERILASTSKEERERLGEQMTGILYQEYRTIPIVSTDRLFLKNSKKVGKWEPSLVSRDILYWEYSTHAPALGTFRLFEP